MVFFAGIDLGSTGIRGIVADSAGRVILNIQEVIPPDKLYMECENPPGWHEQDPRSWVETFYQLLTKLVGGLKKLGLSLEEMKAICTDSTSGTIIAVNEKGNPLTSAIMYNDIRAQEEAQIVQDAAEEFSQKVGYKFKASFSLPKMLWIMRHLPSIFKQTYKILHANDFIVGLLTGEYFHSDTSNCLKAGFDFINGQWPSLIERVGIPLEKLPEVVFSGQKVGRTSEKLEKITGFPSNVLVISGATDSTMALIASGASKEGDFFSSLGTTLVTRCLTRELVLDPQGRVYCHVLPGSRRMFLPGGASSVGAECLQTYFPNIDYKLYDKKALENFPTQAITYPLVKKGERFPFVNSNAKHFYEGPEDNNYEKYAAYLQAVAFVERLSIQVLESLGAKSGGRVFTIGGATKSKEWLQIRADVLQKQIIRPKIIEAAYGAAILAACTVVYDGNLTETIEKFVSPDLIIQPRVKLRDKIEEYYENFLSEITKRFQVQI
ncbi:MAG: FGGY-family carbohydrate kinase [Candidatus Helarchaeota archaeon]|nr:FGGY-family carbohydrate kinase [Candidatus Helarchaeota archaeon]